MKKKKYFTLPLLVLLAALVCVRIAMINLCWPAPEEDIIPRGEKLTINGLTLSVLDSCILTPEQVCATYKISGDSNALAMIDTMKSQGWEAKILVAILNLENNSRTSITFEAGGLMAESSEWSNGIDYNLFAAVNSGETGTLEFAPGTSQQIIIFYDLFNQHFTKNAWKHIEDTAFGLTLMLYPQKVMLEV